MISVFAMETKFEEVISVLGLPRHSKAVPRNDHNSSSLRATRSRGNLFLILIFLLGFTPCHAAVEFDGVNDFITVPNSISLQPAEISGSAWIKIDRVGGHHVIFHKTTNGNEQRGYFFNVDTSGAIRIWVGHGTWVNVIGTSILNIGEWYNVSFTASQANGIKVFLNGVQENLTAALTLPINYAATTDLSIGRDSRFAGSNYFNGSIDDIRIYNRVFSNGDALAIYNSRSKRPSGSLANGLVAHYEMDDDAIGEIAAQAKDSSGNLNHGEFQNFDNLTIALNNDVPANIGTGTSLEFDGVNDYIDAGDINAIDSAQKLTFTLWVKPNLLSDYDTLLQKYSDANNRTAFLLSGGGQAGSDDIQFHPYVAGVPVAVYTTGNYLSTGTWQHLAVVYDGSLPSPNRIKLFHQGDSKAVTIFGTIPANLVNNGINPLEIGRSLHAASREFNGKMDDIRIYNSALTNGEISYLYNGSGLNPGTSNLQALWAFDDDSALKDSSGNDNHGAGVGGDSLKYTEGVLKR